jgi:putative membrane-bound dehydrogenase-like protein
MSQFLKTRSVVFALMLLASQSVVSAADFQLHSFARQQLSDVYYSEGISSGDLNGDGVKDIVYGPHWYAGPDFSQKNEIYPAVPQKREGYADNFFNWIYDFDKDGWNDILVVGFPGTPGFVYRNPGKDGLNGLWEKLQVADSVSNEAPQFADINGDGIPELVCTRQGHYGFYLPEKDKPLGAWKFVSISEKIAPTPFGHGLGVGDVNGDGRMDMIATDGWMEQPAEGAVEGLWKFRKYPFARAGADMFAYDIDGDKDSDIVTALSAHDFGLAWYENTGVDANGDITFEKHLLMGETKDQSPYGLLFTELHAVQLADMNGDGLLDLVTGKTYWSHHTQSPMWDAGAVVYWFELQRGANGAVDFVPHLADGEAGIGRGLVVDDLNKDGLIDIVCGGMKGANVLMHKAKSVTEEEFQQAQPQKRKEMAEGLSPEAAAKQMTVPAGFKVQLAAGEPMVHQPIAMCFDHKGRLWVAEAHTYPLRAPEGEGKDKIVIFEDTTGDGVLDSSKVFIEGLNLVSGLEVGFGGVYVGAAPYLMFIPDRDGDDVPDSSPLALREKPSGAPVINEADNGKRSATVGFASKSETLTAKTELQFPRDVPPGAIVLRDGFGWQDTHETLNAFIWGPDGWLYGCHGVFTHSKVGKPGDSDEQRLPLNAAVWRYHPKKDIFEAFMNGTSNPWGVDFNDKGQAFITACVIPHLWHVIQGARYHRQGGQHFNPYTYDDIKTIADHQHYVGNLADSAWWGHEPKASGATADAGGGHAHCGAMIYLGDNWPDEYRNQIFFNNVHGNRINCDILEPEAGTSGFVGHHGKDLMLANDHYFRGINLRYGPDGSVYLIDWYDKNACHRTNPEIWDRTSGRIYRISHGTPQSVSVNVKEWSDAELIAAHNHRNEWHTRMSRKTLMEKGLSEYVKVALTKLAADASLAVELRLRYLWTLHACGAISEQLTVMLLSDKEEYIRAWAIQFELEDKTASDAIVRRLEEMASDDSSAVVRLYLSSALQRLPNASRWGIATALAARAEDVNDHNLPLMVWYGTEPLVADDSQRAIQLALQSKIPLLRSYILRRASATNETLPAVVAALGGTNDVELQREFLTQMMASFEGRVDIPMPESWKATYDALLKSDQQDIVDQANQLAVLFGDQRVFPPMRSLLGDSNQELGRRQQALSVLVKGQDKAAVEVLQSDAVLANSELQAAAVRALATLGNDSTPALLLERYGKFPNELKTDVVSTLVSRPVWTKLLLNKIADGSVPSSDLHAFHVRQIVTFNDSSLSEMLKKHWGEIRESSADRKAQAVALKKDLGPRVLARANLGNGRRVFSKTCQNCHRLFGTGGQIGPDITGSNRANIDYILENILDPSAVVGRDYQVTVVALQNGQVIQGLLKQETDSALTIQTINDKVVVPKSEIEERTLSNVSMMPERQLETLSKDEVRDLIAYLGSPSQVVLSGPASPIDAKTGKVPGAIEGEAMKIVEKTGGTAASQNMSGFRADRWSGNDHLWWTGAKPGDKLSLEVPVEKAGTYDIEIVLTRARDYGVAKITMDGKVLDPGLDMFNNPDVITTGVLSFGMNELEAGNHRITFEIVGANPEAVKAYMVAIDYVRLVPSQKNLVERK